MNIGLVAKHQKESYAVAKRVVAAVKKRAAIVAEPKLAKAIGIAPKAVERMEVDAIVTVGGDGTILWTMLKNDAPVLGVNMGEIGFLTEVEAKDVPRAVNRLLKGDYNIEERLRLKISLNGRSLPYAVNEAVVRTAQTSKLLHISIRVNGREIERFRADGVILATPTGSTSYSMSAGGPIVDPAVEAVLMTPLAAFRLSARPYVFPARARLETRILSAEKDAVMVLDGQVEHAIKHTDRLVFTGAREPARFVRFTNRFYKRLRERLVL
jgi:NAD+ kinase